MVKSLKLKDKRMENNILPEFVSGIPTAKNRSRERRSLIAGYYSNLWKRLQKEGKKNMIFSCIIGHFGIF